MSKRIVGTTPKVDGFRMPGEFEEQEQIWMLWPWRNDNWRLGAKPAQKAFLELIKDRYKIKTGKDYVALIDKIKKLI